MTASCQFSRKVWLCVKRGGGGNQPLQHVANSSVVDLGLVKGEGGGGGEC